MRNILWAILLSFVVVLIYTFAVLVILPTIMGHTLLEPPSTPQIPLNFPYFVFDKIAPDALQNIFYSTPGGTVLLKLIFFFCNVLFYSIPCYLLIKLFSFLKNKKTK